MIWVFLGLIVAVMGYEVWALYTDQGATDGVTITAILRRWFKHRIILYAFGFLCGHLVWCGG